MVTERLGADELAEVVVGLGHRYGGVRVIDDLQETAGVGATLVELAGRVEEPRPEVQRCGDVPFVPDGQASLLENGCRLWCRSQVRVDTDVFPGSDAGEPLSNRLFKTGLQCVMLDNVGNRTSKEVLEGG